MKYDTPVYYQIKKTLWSEMLANPLCVIVEVLNKAICNEEMLANPLCVIVEVLNKAICNEEMLATFYV